MERPARWIDHYGLQAVACLKKVHIAIYRLRADGWIQIALISPATFTVKTPVIQIALSKGHYYALRNDKATKALDIKNMNTKTLWISTGLQQEVIENSQDLDRSMFRGAGESFYTPMKRRSKDVIEDLLRSASTATSEEIFSARKEEDIERLLQSARTDDGQKAFWKCPLCSFELEIQKGVSTSSARATRKNEEEQGRRKVKFPCWPWH